jgi:hypothetical protein
MGLIVEKLGDNEEACRLFEQAAAADDEWDPPWFNLALNLRRRRRTHDAIAALEHAMQREYFGPELTLRALLATDAKDMAGREKYLTEAAKLWPAPRAMSDWALGWFGVWARETGNQSATTAAAEERRQRKMRPESTPDQGELPAATEPDR